MFYVYLKFQRDNITINFIKKIEFKNYVNIKYIVLITTFKNKHIHL